MSGSLKCDNFIPYLVTIKISFICKKLLIIISLKCSLETRLRELTISALVDISTT